MLLMESMMLVRTRVVVQGKEIRLREWGTKIVETSLNVA